LCFVLFAEIIEPESIFMKIYFCGAHSTGKSTLTKYVSQKYHLPMISETARMILSEQELQIDSLRSNLDTADKYQEQVFDRQLLEEQKHASFVSDRSAIDVLAYSAQHSRILPELISSPRLQEYLQILSDPASIIFFVRPSKATLKADGVREVLNWDGVVAIDAQIKFMLEMWKLSYFQINMDNMQERVRLIDNILNLKL
jgi:nicotinamide riboside kinase